MTLKQIAARALTGLAYNTPIGSNYPVEIAHPIERRFGLVGFTAGKLHSIKHGVIEMARNELKRQLRPDQWHWHGVNYRQ